MLYIHEAANRLFSKLRKLVNWQIVTDTLIAIINAIVNSPILLIWKKVYCQATHNNDLLQGHNFKTVWECSINSLLPIQKHL